MIFYLDFISFLVTLGYQFLFYWMLHTFIPLKKNRQMRVAAFFLSLCLSDVVVYQNDLYNILLPFLALVVYLLVFHQGRIIEKITAVFIFYPIMISINFLMMDIASNMFFAVTGTTEPGAGGWPEEILAVQAAISTGQNLVRFLFWGAIWLFLRKPLVQIRLNLTDKMWMIVDSIIMVSGVACFTAIYFITGPSPMIYPLCIAAVFSSLGCVCLVAYMSNSMQNNFELQKLKMQQKYYEDKLREEERVRSIYHDMKNHLLVLEGIQETDAAQQMIKGLRSQIAEYEDYIHTENEFLDIILREKAEDAREKDIEFSAAVNFSGVTFIEPFDISTLFGNGIDNAIEASEKLPKEQRIILLKAGRVQNFVSILIENHCAQNKDSKRGRTSKKDQFLHGFGISNMEKAAVKYGGHLTIKNDNGTFVLKILIPMPI